MALYSEHESAKLDAPVFVAAFDGWVDAGSAGTMAAQQLAGDGQVLATFDADEIFDYRARRPTLEILSGTLINLEWPELKLRASRVGDRDLVVLTGPEPDYRWHQLSADMVTLAKKLGVSSWISLGAIPVAVPHTRAVPVLGTASAPGLLPPEIAQGPDGRLRVPSAALSVFELAVSEAGIPAAGLFAQVPHYVSGVYPNAAIELLKNLGRFLGMDLPLGDLPARALETRSLLDAATEADERTKAYIERLEAMADEARLPAGDELIADIERFLREREPGRGGEGGNGGNRLN
ncbi:MAG: PAC2 family protein [Chloroflexota bacterium]|nr:PAC2 family protein [Chloroflexota bacterium]